MKQREFGKGFEEPAVGTALATPETWLSQTAPRKNTLIQPVNLEIQEVSHGA